VRPPLPADVVLSRLWPPVVAVLVAAVALVPYGFARRRAELLHAKCQTRVHKLSTFVLPAPLRARASLAIVAAVSPDLPVVAAALPLRARAALAIVAAVSPAVPAVDAAPPPPLSLLLPTTAKVTCTRSSKPYP